MYLAIENVQTHCHLGVSSTIQHLPSLSIFSSTQSLMLLVMGQLNTEPGLTSLRTCGGARASVILARGAPTNILKHTKWKYRHQTVVHKIGHRGYSYASTRQL